MFDHNKPVVTLIAQVILTLLAIVFALPLVAVIGVSLRGEGLQNYVTVLTHPLFPRFFLNSAIVTAGTIVLVFVVTWLAAYAFSKLKFRGKPLLFNMVIMGLLLPSIALIVPIYITFRQLGLFNSYLALILPYTAFTAPFTLLLVRNFLDTVPDELLDAARIDGCSSLTALLWIVLPVSKAISAVVVVWTFLQSWNEYFLALVFMQDSSMRTVTQVPQFFTGEFSVDVTKVFASLVLISLPVIIAYLFLQKSFEQGVTSGAIR